MSAGELPDILEALEALEKALTSVTRVYVKPPDSIAAANLPAIVHDFSKGTLAIVTAGQSRWEVVHVLPVVIFVALEASGSGRAKAEADALVDDYLDMLIDNDSLSGQVKAVQGASWEMQTVEYGGVKYSAISLEISVLVVKYAEA